MEFDFRGLEMHGVRMWERHSIVEALEFIKQHDLTALVLHETDLLHQVVFPRKLFDPYALWSGTPTRRGENAIQNNRVYLDHVLNLAKRYGVALWIELKELTFPDEVLERYPYLLKDGVVCPSEPVWLDFLQAQFEELAADFPDLAGVIMSPGSPEGRASRAQEKCGCVTCQNTNLTQWYLDLIKSSHAPLAAAGIQLAVRDFAYKPSDHEPLIEAIDRAPSDVIFCIKVTPHDFYPTFPHNPAIGRLRNRQQWIEYDVYGQFYGWGVFPALMTDDLTNRLQYAANNGVTGTVFRTEWERVNDWWCLETPNRVNLVMAARLTTGEQAAPESALIEWLHAAGWDATPGASTWLADILGRMWPLLEKGIYLNDFVFHDSSMFPRSISKAWWTMEVKHSLVAWDPSRTGDLQLDAERITGLLAEKDAAVSGAKALLAEVKNTPADLERALRTWTEERMTLFVQYLTGFRLITEACLYTRWSSQESHQMPAEYRATFDRVLTELEQFRAGLLPLAKEAKYPHQVVMLLDYRRVDDVVSEGRDALRSYGKIGA